MAVIEPTDSSSMPSRLPGAWRESLVAVVAAMVCAAPLTSGCLVSQYRLYDGPPRPVDQVAILEVSNGLVREGDKLAIVCRIDSVPGTNSTGTVRGCESVTPENTCFNDTGLTTTPLGFTAEIAPGPHQLVVVPSGLESPIPDTIGFEAKPGRRYTVRIPVQMLDRSFWTGAATMKWRAEVVDIGENTPRK